MKKWALVAVAVLAAVVVPLAWADGKKPADAGQPGAKPDYPPLEKGRSYFFAYEFSGDIRKLHSSSPNSVEGEYLGEQHGSWVKVRQTRSESSRDRPTVFWVNLDRVSVIKIWPRDGDPDGS
jgi:hypothetical protein